MTLLDRIFTPRILYVRLFKNRMVVTDTHSGRQASGNASNDFSNDRLLIADMDPAISLFNELLIELFGSGKVRRSHQALIQPVDHSIKEISAVENRIYIDFAEIGGALSSKVYPTQEELSNQEVLEYLKKK